MYHSKLYYIFPLVIIISIILFYMILFIVPWYRYSKNFRNLFTKNFSVFDSRGNKLVKNFSMMLILPLWKNCYVYGGFSLIVDMLIYSNDEIYLKYFSKELKVDFDSIMANKLSGQERIISNLYTFLTPAGGFRSCCAGVQYIMKISCLGGKDYYFAIDEDVYRQVNLLKGVNND